MQTKWRNIKFQPRTGLAKEARYYHLAHKLRALNFNPTLIGTSCSLTYIPCLNLAAEAHLLPDSMPSGMQPPNLPSKEHFPQNYFLWLNTLSGNRHNFRVKMFPFSLQNHPQMMNQNFLNEIYLHNVCHYNNFVSVKHIQSIKEKKSFLTEQPV